MLTPYLAPATSAYWSTSGTFPWLYLARPTNPATPTSALTTSTNTLTSTTTSASTSTTSTSTSTASTSMSTTLASGSPTSSLLCGGNPAFSQIPTVDNGAKGDLGQCYTYCQVDVSCMAFGYVAAVGDCFLYNSAIYYPADASGTSGIYYWNLDCFTTTSSISTLTGST